MANAAFPIVLGKSRMSLDIMTSHRVNINKQNTLYFNKLYMSCNMEVKIYFSYLASATCLLAKSLLQNELWVPRGITPMGILEISSWQTETEISIILLTSPFKLKL